MISLYKRYIFWWCRVLQRIPGYRWYGRWLERQYTKRFWTMTIGGYMLSLAGLIWTKRVMRPLNTPAVNDPWEGFTLCPSCKLYHHPVHETCADAIAVIDDPCRITGQPHYH